MGNYQDFIQHVHNVEGQQLDRRTVSRLLKDAVHIIQKLLDEVERLESQKTMKPVGKVPWARTLGMCPSCTANIMVGQKYCDRCGQALDWESFSGEDKHGSV